ncbi:MAG: hypothetical protein MJ123_09465 [Lachnospiraceae bacterium]|nr:hypothetical protein [Lachnospiraceae bacterium]
MNKRLLFISIIVFSFAFMGCGAKRNDAESSISQIDEVSSDANETSISSSGSVVSTSSAASVSKVLSDSTDQTDDGVDEIEGVEVDDDDKPSVNEAFRPEYDDLEGSYFDEYSERATAEIESFGCEAKVTVSWPESAYKHGEWEMTVTIKDSKLVYTDCMYMDIDESDINNPKYEVVYMDESGYFEIKDGKLYWTGAVDEGCRKLVFSKPNHK